jgi:ubiquinone/menaquinone biosynthesis C-methylase UbiE
MSVEKRKLEEAEFHDKLRGMNSDDPEFNYLTSNRKLYSVAESSKDYYKDWLKENCENLRVLDYGSGDGSYSFFLAQNGAEVVGVDISEVSVSNCQQLALDYGLQGQTSFKVMDAEALEFEDNSFDIVCEAGVLHHVDLNKAFSEISRVLKPTGKAICYEALGHNRIFQLYRQLTPHLRTKFETEHILGLNSLELATEYFDNVEVKFFHLAVLAAVPFRNMPGFKGLLQMLESLDSWLFNFPIFQRQAWMMIFVLSNSKSR